MPIAGANMDAFIVTRGPLITIWTCLRGLILKPSSLQKPALLINCAVNWRVQNIGWRPIAIGTNTDPYQAIEGRYQTTRQILEVMLETRHPVAIVTKGAMIERDIDLFSALAEQGLRGSGYR